MSKGIKRWEGVRRFQGKHTLVATTPKMAKALKAGKRKNSIAKTKRIRGLGLDVSAISPREYIEKAEENADRIGHQNRIARALERMAKSKKVPRRKKRKT